MIDAVPKARHLDHRQRAFARAIAEGKSKAEAQLFAGYKVNRKNANILIRDDRVIAEIERIRDVIERERYRLLAERDERFFNERYER